MLVEKTITGFIDELASDLPAPGGGSVAALSGALGAGLLSMVCNLTIGKEKYKDVEADLKELLPRAEEKQKQLLELIDTDTESFNKVMAAFKLPKGNEEEKKARSEAIQKATIIAAQVPLDAALTCLEVLRLAPEIAEKGNINAASDVGVAAQQAEAGLHGAVLNVKINLSSIKDQDFVKKAESQVEEYLAEGEKIKKEVMSVVQAKL